MKSTDLSVFNFNEEDEMIETCSNPWSKLANPKYDFFQHASLGSTTQLKEVHSVKRVHVSIDNDDRDLINFNPDSFQDPSIGGASKQSEVFGSLSDRMLQESCRFNGDAVDHSNGSVDVGPSDDCDSIHGSSSSTTGSEQEETTFPFEELPQGEMFSGLDMKMDTVLPADYVYYGKKYFPACLIVFSETSLKIETESDTSRFEWSIEDIHGIESKWCSRAFTAKVEVRILTKDAVPEENKLENIIGVEELEFLVHDPLWLQRQECIISLDVRYSAIWRTEMMSGKACEGGSLDSESSQPYIPKFEEPFDEVVYPKGDKDAISISKTDVELLEPDTFLNDTIIDFYLKYLQNKIPPTERGRFYFFNSFFFTKLADPNKNTSGVFDGKAGFQRVRKWTRKVNIFEKDFIFIPVNYSLHWSLIVICHPGEIAKFNEENLDQSVKVPCVLHMDSIRGSHTGLKDLVQSYLLEEWKEKHKEISEDIIKKFSNLRFLSLELPQQENLSDCGLFLLHYAERFISEAPENFSPFLVNKFDKFLKPDWFMPAEASLKRVYIQRLIYNLLEDCPVENTWSSDDESQLPELLENHKNIEVLAGGTRPAKSWNPLHSQSVQGMDIGLIDMSLCSNVSSFGMRDLLECQNYVQEESFVQPGCPAPPVKVEVDVDHHTTSTLDQSELQSIDEVAPPGCPLPYTPGIVNQGFQWSSQLSDCGTHHDENSPHSSNHSSDSEELVIMEQKPEVEGPTSSENRNSDPHQEKTDILMETLADGSQEMPELHSDNSLADNSLADNSLENPTTPNVEEAKEIEDPDIIANVNDVVEDSSSDLDEEGRVAKRIRLMPSSEGERESTISLSKEVVVSNN